MAPLNLPHIGLSGLTQTLIALCAGLCTGAMAQLSTEPTTQGLRDNTPRWHAITQARIVTSPGRVIENGTLVMKDGVITAVGAGLKPPAGARVWALPGRTVYAGFIDLASPLGVPAALAADPKALPASDDEDAAPTPARPAAPRSLSARSLSASNPLVRPEQDVATQLQWPQAQAKGLRELGFTAVLASPGHGVFRGQSALVALGESASARASVLLPRAAQHMALDFHSGMGGGGYPNSLMGAIALSRQTLLNARWHLQAQQEAKTPQQRPEPNASLEALAPVVEGRQAVFFQAQDEQDDERLARLRDEFRLQVVMQGTGREYRRLSTLKAQGLRVIVPLNLPEAPAIVHPDEALDVPLETLQHWEQARANAARVAQAGIPMALTAAGLKEPAKQFWPQLRRAVRSGLSPEAALAALTTTPAAWLGQSQRLGEVAAGRLAHVVVSRGDLFAQDDAEVELSFVGGVPLPTSLWGVEDWRGRWALEPETPAPAPTTGATGAAGAAAPLVLEVSGSLREPQARVGSQKCALSRQAGGWWVLRWPCAAGQTQEPASTWVFKARADGLSGTVQRGQGPLQAWSARKLGPATPDNPTAAAPAAAPAAVSPETRGAASAETPAKAEGPPPPWQQYPAGAYGFAPGAAAQASTLLLQGATVWTQGPMGRLEAADVLVRQGQIVAVGRQLPVPAGAQVVSAVGKHITPGLIDAHSHIAIARGVNEASHSVTAEVRIGDVLDATDISLYRQLAGGLTAANLLHGSANTIGGQSQVIKLRWGQPASALVFEGAKPSNKFALGENVKRSNWGAPDRYPTTRMGVEQLLRDQFAAAAEYEREWKTWRAQPKASPPPRTDLRLQALAEILQRQRLVHIHSYRADEILMFARMARELGVEVAAFQHVLEGYKVADAMADIGAGGSTFTDWWAYKMEVQDAVPDNGPLMARAGVLTSFNSDDANLARRMNTEAAKAIKYGGLSEQEALNFVTINPARQLRIEARVGSLEAGKDADFVVWSGPPLSAYSRVEQTWIDGRLYFSQAQDEALKARDQAERQRLMAAALKAQPAAGKAAAGPSAGAPAGGTPRSEQDAQALSHLLRHSRSHRESYSDEAGWHECTEDAHQ
jgi:imidazolonepropionase-like amidohydrolase